MNFFQKKESTKKEGASLLKSLPGCKVMQQLRLSQTGDQTRSAQEHTILKSDAFPMDLHYAYVWSLGLTQLWCGIWCRPTSPFWDNAAVL